MKVLNKRDIVTVLLGALHGVHILAIKYNTCCSRDFYTLSFTLKSFESLLSIIIDRFLFSNGQQNNNQVSTKSK